MNTDRAVRINQLLFTMLRQYDVSDISCLLMGIDIDRALTECVREGYAPYLYVVQAIEHRQINVLPYVPHMAAACILEYERQREGRKLVGS